MQLLATQGRRAETGESRLDFIALGAALTLESIELAHKLNRPAEADSVEAAASALIVLPLAVLSQGSRVLSLAVLADGRLASGGDDGEIKAWPKEDTGEPVVLSVPARSGWDRLGSGVWCDHPGRGAPGAR
jgi:hypothetical protein